MAVGIGDIADALGREVPADGSPEARQWQMWIDDAALLIKARLGALEELDQDNLAYVIREAVVAQVRRPDDATSVEVGVDDGRVTKRYSSARGRVFIRDEWWRLLDPGSRGGAFAVDLVSQRAVAHVPWCSLHFGGEYCTCGAIYGKTYEVWP